MTRGKPPAWARRVEKGLAPPGWVQLEVLRDLAPDKTELDAAALTGPEHMHVFTNADGEPALTRSITLGDGWDYEGIVVPASAAHKAGLINTRQLAGASRRWT